MFFMNVFIEWLTQHKKIYSDHIRDEIRHIRTTMPKRGPASEGERRAADYLAQKLREDCNCDEVYIEPYETHPGVFYGWLYITSILYLIAIGLYHVKPAVSVILIVAGYIVDALEF